MYILPLFLVLFSFSATGDADTHAPGFRYKTSFVQVNDKQLETYVAGEGAYTIVFEPGLGVAGKSWLKSRVFRTMSQNCQVIAYNRAGYGASTQNGENRDLQQLSDDLAAIIDAKSVNHQVIIVGHSLGGAIARTYAIQHPGKVWALLFIDPTHEKFSAFAEITQEFEDLLVQQETRGPYIGTAQEASQLLEDLAFLQALSLLPDIPVTVLTSTKTGKNIPKTEVEDWAAAHQSLGQGLSRFSHIQTRKSGHFIYLDEPRLVIEEIKKFLL